MNNELPELTVNQASIRADAAQATGERDAASKLAEEGALQSLGQREAAAALAEGQRVINVIWETTQMRLALSVIWGSLVVSAALAVFGRWLGTPDLQLAAIVFLFGVANLVTGFYFGRTNHTRVGGVGGSRVRDGR